MGLAGCVLSCLPHLSLCSHNICRLSAYADTPTGVARQHNQASNIRKQATMFDVLLFQDTGLRVNDRGAFKAVGGLHHWRGFDSNDERGVRCVSSLFSPRLQKLYSFSTRSSFGVVISHLLPKMDTLHPCQIINVYLDPKSRAVRQSQLQFVRDNTKTGVFSYMMGDFNFVENLDDGKMLGHQALATAEQQVWDGLRDHLTLKEISQPTHTWYRFESNSKIVSSRIDRAYLSCREADHTLATPLSFIPSLPHTSLRKEQVRRSGSEHLIPYHTTSDHYPVGVRFVPTQPSNRRSFNIPTWLAKSGVFQATMLASWSPLSSSFAAADNFKAHARRTAKLVLKQAAAKAAGTLIGNLSAAIALLRRVNAGDVDSDQVKTLLDRHPSLNKCVDPSTHLPSYSLTAGFIEETIVSPPAKPDLTPATPNHTSLHTNIIKGIKAQMPSERKRLSGFVDYGAEDEEINLEYPDRVEYGEGVITDSDKMASLIKVYFGKIWAKRDGAPSREEIRQYLQGYGACVPTGLHPSFPNWSAGAVCSSIELSWMESVLGVIKGSNDSCAGPDGVPFAVYRSLPSICCPFLLDIIIELAKGTKPPDWFNLGRLFLIPKDDSGKVLNHRPITVNNSDNRLVASVLAGVITPACQAIIHHSQKGFIPGRSGDDHIVARLY